MKKTVKYWPIINCVSEKNDIVIEISQLGAARGGFLRAPRYDVDSKLR